MENLRNRVEIALFQLTELINQPSLLTGENGDEWLMVLFHLREAEDVIEGMEGSTDD